MHCARVSTTLCRMRRADEDLVAWNSVAGVYSTKVGHDSDPIYQRFRDFLWRHVGNDLTGAEVLDLGCGHGWLAELCRTRGAAVVGVDGSDALLAIARTKFPDVEFGLADLCDRVPASITFYVQWLASAGLGVVDLVQLATASFTQRRGRGVRGARCGRTTVANRRTSACHEWSGANSRCTGRYQAWDSNGYSPTGSGSNGRCKGRRDRTIRLRVASQLLGQCPPLPDAD